MLVVGLSCLIPRGWALSNGMLLAKRAVLAPLLQLHLACETNIATL